MDFVTPLLALLVPHLPALLNKATEDVVGEGAKKVVFGAVPAGVKAIWAKVWPKVEKDPDAKSAAQKVAIDPENTKRLTALEMAIEDVLTNLAKQEPEWMAGLQELMEQNKPEVAGGNSATVTAETIYSSVVGPNATVTQTIGLPVK